jgi:(2Fe-2S) ferredoxin
MLVDTRDAARSIRCGEFTDDTALLELPLDGSRGRLDPSPIYLVCTHGRHDPCCGQRGRPVVASLAARRPEHVWQASHLGGCRFAPTVLVLPAGVMYGRVPASAAADVVAAAEAGEVLGEFFRGRIGITPAAQAALGFAHERLELPRVQDVSVASIVAGEGTTVVVRVDTPRGPFDVTVERKRIDAGGLTCGAPGPSWFVGHRPLTIEPAGDR